jgi:hypothetical protein
VATPASRLRISDRPAVEQLLVEFDEVLLAGAAEQQAGTQRDAGGAAANSSARARRDGASVMALFEP